MTPSNHVQQRLMDSRAGGRMGGMKILVDLQDFGKGRLQGEGMELLPERATARGTFWGTGRRVV